MAKFNLLISQRIDIIVKLHDEYNKKILENLNPFNLNV